MKYGRVLEIAWNSTWKRWALWGYSATWTLASVGVGLLVGVAAVGGTLALDSPSIALVSLGALPVLLVVWIFLYSVFHGGFIYLTNEQQQGRPVGVGAGWREGWRVFGRLFPFEFVFGVFSTIAVGVIVVLPVAALIAISSGAGALGALDSGGVQGLARQLSAVLPALCCLLVLWVLAFTLLTPLMSSFEAVGSRHIVIDGRRIGESFSWALGAMRARLKWFFLMGLIVVGLNMGFNTISNIVSTPTRLLQDLGSSASDRASGLMITIVAGLVTTLIVSLIQIPWLVLLYNVWTAFYRILTGRDVQSVASDPPVTGAVGFAPPAPPSAFDGAPMTLPVSSAPRPPAPSAPPAPEPPAPPSDV